MFYIWSSFISASRSVSCSDYGTVVVGNPNALVGNPNKTLTGRIRVEEGGFLVFWNGGFMTQKGWIETGETGLDFLKLGGQHGPECLPEFGSKHSNNQFGIERQKKV